MKKLTLSLIMFSSMSMIFSCGNPETTTKPAVKTAASAKPDDGTINFTNRKQAAAYLLCQTNALMDGPSLLQKELLDREDGKPKTSDEEALKIYNKHINDFIRIYPIVLTACKTDNVEIQKKLNEKRKGYIVQQ